MMAFQKSLKFVRTSPTVINTVKNLLFRVCSTEVRAVARTGFRKPKRLKGHINFAGYALLAIPVSAFGLGTWQVFRKFEKEKIIEQFMEKINQPPVELPKNLEELKNMEYRKVKVKGKFHHDKELYLGPRNQICDDPLSKYGSLISRSKGGYMVITPFELSDRKQPPGPIIPTIHGCDYCKWVVESLTILVNRGWVPAKMKSPLARKEGQIPEEVELVGLVRLHEERQPLGMSNMPEKGYWVYRDLYKMAEIAGTAPVLIDADKASTVTGGPIGGQTIVEVRNVHLSYIYTWYGLALISSWLWYKKFIFRRPQGLDYITKP